ncbi:unnamed protein product [Linum grandiflorum]
MVKLFMNAVLHLVLLALATETLSVANAQNCGPEAHWKKCPEGVCCSQYGWCGTTDLHCQKPSPSPGKSFDVFDQTDYVDMVDVDRFKTASGARATRIVHQTIRPQITNNDGNFSSNFSTNEDDSRYNNPSCGTQGKGSCAEGLCCSKWGFCGTSDDYCGKGCQDSCSNSAPSPITQ